MPRGGKREGAGRKPKRQKYSGPINKAEKRIADQLPHLIDKMLELADGVEVQTEDKNGETTIYSRPPDRDAIKYLVDRVMGRPTERQEIAGEDGGPLKIQVEYGLDSNDPPTEAPPGAAADPEGKEAV